MFLCPSELLLVRLAVKKFKSYRKNWSIEFVSDILFFIAGKDSWKVIAM